MGINRRDLLRLASTVPLLMVGGSSISACGKAPSASIGPTWFTSFGTMVLAPLIADGASKALSSGWSAWEEGRRELISYVGENGWNFISNSTLGDQVPPALIFRACRDQMSNPATDLLVVGVNQCRESVIFEPWAWQALYLFVNDLTHDKKGDDLAGFQALCKISLLPSGVSDTTATATGRSTLMGYRTRNGSVEMNRRTGEEGETIVQVTATGIPTSEGLPTVRDFVLPK
ncbi:hypothetical protein CFAEC_13020 [Corynebacterium faecale]|nr:hypothetical protein CFAEC_13020 [Corynebacterium faecale]